MARLTICRGLSGCGKSTWASVQSGYPVIVSRDSLREALFGSADQDYYTTDGLSDREDLITKVEHDAIRRALLSGRDVISDNTNVEMRFVNALAKIGYACDAEVVVKVFDVGVDTAIARNMQRAANGGRNVPEHVIKRQAERFKPHAALPERPVVKPYTGTPDKPKAFMVDIDGTLADMADKRGPYDLNVEVDDVREKVADAVEYIRMGMRETPFETATIIMSGRKEDCREATERWLSDWGINYDHLFMRKSDDNRSDNLIKHDLFWEHVAPNFDVQFVFDDRDQVVHMWRKMGLDCFQVAPGDF
jgi:predicted kinase